MGGKGAGLPDFCHMRLTSLSGISKFSNTAFQELCGTIFLVRTLMSWGRALMSALCLVSFGGNQIYLGSIYHAMELYLFRCAQMMRLECAASHQNIGALSLCHFRKDRDSLCFGSLIMIPRDGSNGKDGNPVVSIVY